MKYLYRGTVIVESGIPLDSTAFVAVKEPEPTNTETKKPVRKTVKKA